MGEGAFGIPGGFHYRLLSEADERGLGGDDGEPVAGNAGARPQLAGG